MPDTTEVPDAATPAELPAYVPTQLPDTFAFRWIVPYLGGWVALLLLPLALVAGVPFFGWLIAFSMWALNTIGQRVVALFTMGLPATLAVGAAGMTMMLRVWTIAIILFFVGAQLDIGSTSIGLGQRELAIPAMLIFLVIFTFDVAVRSLAELHRYKSSPGAAAAAASAPTTPREELA